MEANAVSRKHFNTKAFISKYAMYVILIVLIAIFGFAQPAFFTGKNFVNILTSESSRGLLALGVAFCIITRGIDLSLGSVMAVSSVFSASLVQKLTYSTLILPGLVNLPEIPAWVAFLFGILVGTSFGVINGLLVAYTKIHPFIATLGSMTIARGLALLYTNAYPVPMLREDFTHIGQGTMFGVLPNIVCVFLLMAVVANVLLNHTRFGKNMFAVGGNVDAARASGINVEKTLVFAYPWSAFCASLAGVMVTARSASGIASLGDGYELDGIAAATVGGVSQTGGVGSIVGCIGGILVLGVINNGLLITGVSPYLQKIIKGAIIVIAVVFDMRKVARKK
jgi:ribose/xylose/arabinose/galactoside ABC-type transport system permease subunit